MAKQRFIYKGLLPDLKALDEGWEITDDDLEQLASNIANPLNEQFPYDYVEITEAQYQRIRKDAINYGVFDQFQD